MADILIRGMEMPKTCADCHDADLPTAIAWLGAKCPWSTGIIPPGTYDLRNGRHPDCPIVELPPHGDLIDLDERLTGILYDSVSDDSSMVTKTIRDWLGFADELPTIVIPAERSDSE